MRMRNAPEISPAAIFVGIEKLAYQAPVRRAFPVFTVNTEKAHKLLPASALTLMPVTQQQCLQQGMEYAAAAPKGRGCVLGALP